jgi:taurine dioxygenase
MTTLQVNPLTPAIGASIDGVDMSGAIDDSTRDAIKQAVLDHEVVFIPKQTISPDQHIEMARWWGDVEDSHPFIPALDEEHPEIRVLDSSEGYRANAWHTDVTFQPAPPMGSVLHMQHLPATGGDTMWASSTAAYNALSDRMKVMIDGLTAVHRTSQRDPAVHPVVRTHPETGRKGLFVNEMWTGDIVELPQTEGRAILAMLYEIQTQPEFTCRWRFSEGDLAIWDNRCTQHYALADYGDTDRRIHRVTILGDEPV